MKPTVKKMSRGRKWLVGVLYGVSLGLVFGLAGASPAWAEKEKIVCPTTLEEW